MSKIKNITAFEALDSIGNPALHVTVHLEDGVSASASVASNNFQTTYSLIDVRDNDPKRFSGYGLLQAVSIVENVIKPRIVGLECDNQQQIDKTLLSLDTSVNKSKIGGNTLMSISEAVVRTSAKSRNEPLFFTLQRLITAVSVRMPVPIFTMIDGGKNANYNTEIHEFLILPATNKKFGESIEMGSNIHKKISEILLKENILPFVGEKGGFGPLLSTNEDALSLISHALETLSIRLGYDVYLGMDVNADTFFKDDQYKIKDHNIPMNRNEMVKFYAEMCKKYHILYLEDPFGNEDISGWTEALSTLNQSTIIAGDYFTATSPLRLQMALEKKTINGIVIKPSSIGTVTESLAVALMAKTAGIKVIVSDRTNSTNDTFLADFAVAISADYVRFGAPRRGERVAKYNRLLEIEKEIEGTNK